MRRERRGPGRWRSSTFEENLKSTYVLLALIFHPTVDKAVVEASHSTRSKMEALRAGSTRPFNALLNHIVAVLPPPRVQESMIISRQDDGNLTFLEGLLVPLHRLRRHEAFSLAPLPYSRGP